MRQPVTRHISEEFLFAKVKTIYAWVVQFGSRCIEVDNNQSPQDDSANKLNNDQWQSLIALYSKVLDEHHDFFLASQHPSASPALRGLASKYHMPARLWQHGFHGFLKLLRQRLPANCEHMLNFIYIAYSLMTLFYETVLVFDYTWVEYLGHLGRYPLFTYDRETGERKMLIATDDPEWQQLFDHIVS
ncbi:hypothetical protein VTK56DRAFT_4653 [Thermocarpiscus australiensis]